MATKYKNIVGTAFPPYIKKQLQVREEQGGQNTRSPQQLEYLTNRNSYFRLSSAAATGTEKPRKFDLTRVTDIVAQSTTVNPTTVDISGNNNKALTTEGPVIEFDFNTKLARENVLQGGIIEIQEFGDENNKTYKEKQKKGFSETYNQGESDRLGLQPMPGITGITIGTGGKWQTLMQADIEFICYNLDQLNIMSKLYMSLGVNVFLEYGHIPYFDNNGNFNTNQQFLDFFNINDKEVLLKKVTKKRKTTNGNYDAFLGTVYNFSYESDKDGAYMCKTQIMGAGGMVESLKVNSSYNFDFTRGKTDESEKFTSTLDNVFYTLKEFLRDAEINKTYIDQSSIIPGETLLRSDFGHTSTDKWFKPIEVESNWLGYTIKYDSWGGILNNIMGNATYTPYSFIQIAGSNKGAITYNNDNAMLGNATQIVTGRALKDVDPGVQENDNLRAIPTSFYSGYATQYQGDGVGRETDLDPDTTLTYITFGHLMALVQSFGIFVETTSPSDVAAKQSKKTKPPIYIDYHPDNTLINVGPISATINPYKVFVPFSANKNTYADFFSPLDINDHKWYEWLMGEITPKQHNLLTNSGGIRGNFELSVDGNQFTTEDKKPQGKLFNILINLDFARDCLKSTTDESGDISLIEYVNKILDGINESLGGVNNLRTFVDECGMVLRIVDEKVSKKVTEENLLELKTFGKNSTVYDSSYSSAITPKLASQIVIATQAATKGGIKDFPEDVLSYVSLNDDTKDRFSVYKYPPVLTAYGEEQKNKKDLKKQKEILASLRRLYDHLFYVYTSNAFETFGNITKTVCQNMIQPYLTLCGQREKEESDPSTILIPLEYTITLDGISGILPYNAFKIPNDRLPKRYRDRVAFIVFSINHSFDNNNWRTTLRGQTIMLKNTGTPVIRSTISGTKSVEDNPNSPEEVVNKYQNFPKVELTSTVTTPQTVTYTSKDSPKTQTVTDTTPYINEGQTPVFETANVINSRDIDLTVQFTAPNENNTSLEIFEPYQDIDYTVPSGKKMRIGFGSNTITKDGEWRSVKKGDIITNKEAYDDLERVLKTVTKPYVVNKLKEGGVDYSKLDIKMQVVTLDIAYNYGGNHKTLYNQFVSAIKKGKQGLIDELQRRIGLGANQVPTRRQKEIDYLIG
jgi:hypothetical protein